MMIPNQENTVKQPLKKGFRQPCDLALGENL
jgi:hypothetical protein